MVRSKQSLSGWWQYAVNGRAPEAKEVPFSAFCVGESECQLSFTTDLGEGSTLLCFEGITYEADITLNGNVLGTMLPYCRYRYDITDMLNSGGNILSLRIRDIGTVFSSEGWENYSGIIREVYLLHLPQTYIDDFFWHTQFSSDYRSAVCHLDIELGGKQEDCTVKAELIFEGETVCVTQGSAPALSWEIHRPFLWSPDHPHLYTLRICLVSPDGDMVDSLSASVGFKELKAVKNRFVLNGKPIFLRGVCRHDMWGHCAGHTLSESRMRQDLQMIKNTGANFVRLVHYPHHHRIIELADEIGLLVSEEPSINGLYGLQGDIYEQPVVSPGLEVLKKTILRDRSHVSVAFWLAYNECVVPVSFIQEVSALCRRLDPTRMVSGASCMRPKLTKERFSAGGFDFYTHHPYGSRLDAVSSGFNDGPDIDWSHLYSVSLRDILAELDDKPLLFTEWGGLHVVDNPALFTQFLDFMIRAWKSQTPGTVLSGMSYWNWADIYEINRGSPDCKAGILVEGLVDVDRNPRINLSIFTQKLAEIERNALPKPPEEEVYAVVRSVGADRPVDISAYRDREENRLAWEDAVSRARCVPGVLHKENRRLDRGPVLFKDYRSLGGLAVHMNSGIPIVISRQNRAVEIPVEGPASEVLFIGNVCLNGGYPIGGKHGEVVAKYVIIAQDGFQQEIPLRNGSELTTVWGLHLASRIDPRAINAHRVMKLTYDENWETYCINGYSVYLNGIGHLSSIRIELVNDEYDLLLYGVTLRK